MADLNELDPKMVTTGKPVEGGAVWTSFADDPELPTDAATKMSTLEGFESLGETGSDGFTHSRSVESSELKDWHNTVLLSPVTGETNKFKIVFLEVNRPTVAKLVYGEDAVKVGADGSVSAIDAKAYAGTPRPLVIDELESNGFLRRTVVPKAVVTSFDDETHGRGDFVSNGLEFTALAPDDGSEPYHVYRAKPASA